MPTERPIFWLAGLGIGSGLAFGLYAIAAVTLAPSKLGMLGMLEALVATLLAVQFLNEELGAYTVLGGVIMLTATWLLIRDSNGRKKLEV